MEQVEVKLLNYTLRFKRMYWREEFAIKFPPGKDRRRVFLAHALLGVSGVPPTEWLKPEGLSDALRVMDAIPSAIVERVFRIWRGSFPPARRFTTTQLYRAPEPNLYTKRVGDDEGAELEDGTHDMAIREMQAKFGMQEVADTQALDRQILNAARRREGGYKGAIPASEEKPGG